MNTFKKILSMWLLVGSSIYAQDSEQQITKALGGQSPYETGNLVTGSSGIQGSGVAALSSAYGCFIHSASASSGYVSWEATLFALSTGIESSNPTRIKIYQSGVYFINYELYDSSGVKLDAIYSAFLRLNGDNDKIIISDIAPFAQGDYIELFANSSFQYARIMVYKIADIGATGSPVTAFAGLAPLMP